MKTVLQIVPCKGWGGGERYVHDLTQQLQERCYKVVVVGRKSEIVASKFATLGSYTVLPLLFLFDFYSAFKLGRIVSRNGVDVIHVHIFKDAFMAVFARFFTHRKFKVVMTRHLVRSGKGGALYRWMYSKLDTLIFVSQTACDAFLTTNPPVDASKIAVVFNSVKVAESQHIFDETVTRIGFAGRLDREKGVEVLLDAAKKLTGQFTVTIAGTGDAAYVEELKAKSNGNVKFVGFVDDMNIWRREVDVGVVSSIAVESFSLVTLEFMASGIVVVASNGGGPTEIIENGVDGFLFEKGSSEALAEQLQILIDNRDLLLNVGAAAIDKFQRKFSYEKFADKIEGIYRITS